MRSVKQLLGCSLDALDGEFGHVKGFYFDDRDWVVRYLIAGSGTRIPCPKVLISPYALGSLYAAHQLLEVKLTREMIQSSPSIDADSPFFRQHEEAYHRHHGWPFYWDGPYLWGSAPTPALASAEECPLEPQTATAGTPPHYCLRTIQEVIGYSIEVLDGIVGHVEDFLVDDSDWAIRFLVAATRHPISGKNVLVPPQAIGKASWKDSKLLVNLTRKEIQRNLGSHYIDSDADSHDRPIFRLTRV